MYGPFLDMVSSDGGGSPAPGVGTKDMERRGKG